MDMWDEGCKKKKTRSCNNKLKWLPWVACLHVCIGTHTGKPEEESLILFLFFFDYYFRLLFYSPSLFFFPLPETFRVVQGKASKHSDEHRFVSRPRHFDDWRLFPTKAGSCHEQRKAQPADCRLLEITSTRRWSEVNAGVWSRCPAHC